MSEYLKIEINEHGRPIYFICTKGEPDSIVRESCVEINELEYKQWMEDLE